MFWDTSRSKKPVSVYVDDSVVPSASDAEARSATDTGTETGGSSSNAGEKEDWDRMDSASDLGAAANALRVEDCGATVRGDGSRELSKSKKGKSPHL